MQSQAESSPPSRRIPVAFHRKCHFSLLTPACYITNGVRNEESWCLINRVCSCTACCRSQSRGTAANENPADRILIWLLPFHSPGQPLGIPAGSARAWLRGGKKHCH